MMLPQDIISTKAATSPRASLRKYPHYRRDSDIFSIDTINDTTFHSTNSINAADEPSLSEYILPKRRVRLLNLRYLCRFRGIIKIMQTLFIFSYIISCTQLRQDLYLNKYAEERLIFAFASPMLTFNTAIIIGYIAFPHLTVKDEAGRNGMLFLEIINAIFSCAVLTAIISVRIVHFIIGNFSIEAMLLLSIVEFPLALAYLCDLIFLFNEWTLITRIMNVKRRNEEACTSQTITLSMCNNASEKLHELSEAFKN
uniref:Serpentine receptor class gamma n=1 Tax=Parascaris univalens TaxID=6257 RepID=A0A915B5X6_PARUN